MKNKIKTAVFLCLTIGVAVFGFSFMSGLVEQRQLQSLSKSGTVRLSEKDKPNEAVFSGMENDEWENEEDAAIPEAEEDGGIALEDLRLIVANKESNTPRELHEPYGVQLGMEQANEKGIEWLRQMEHLWLDYFHVEHLPEYEMSWAWLYEKPLDVEGLSREYFSYWDILYHAGYSFSVRLHINAVTGQVLYATINSSLPIFDFTKYSNEFLKEFMYCYGSTLSFRPEDYSGRQFYDAEKDDYNACLSVGDDKLYIMMRINTICFVEGENAAAVTSKNFMDVTGGSAGDGNGTGGSANHYHVVRVNPVEEYFESSILELYLSTEIK